MARRPKTTEAQWCETLVYLDGPQLVTLNTPGTSKIIGVAIERNGFDFPFFGAEISSDQYYAYMSERVDLRYLFEAPAFKRWVFFDLSEIEDEYIDLYPAHITPQIKSAFYPGSGFFSRDHTISSSLREKSFSKGIQEFDIDGAWDLSDFSAFGDRMTEVYAVFNSIDTFLDENIAISKRRQIQEGFMKPYRGGSSYVSLYKSIPTDAEIRNRLAIKSMAYASPGHITVGGDDGIFSRIKSILEIVSANENEIYEQYKTLKRYISNNSLAAMDADEFISRYGRDTEIPRQIKSESKKLSEMLFLVQFSAVYDLSGKNPLVCGKILLSFYRRILRLREFFIQGRVNFST